MTGGEITRALGGTAAVQARRWFARWGVLAVSCILSVSILAYAVALALDSRHMAIVNAMRLTAALAQATSQRVSGTVRSLDVLLTEAAETMNRPDAVGERQLEFFRTKITSFPEVRGIAVIDPTGLMTANTIPETHKLSGKLRVADRQHFQGPRDRFPERELFITDPLVDRGSGRTAIYLARAIAAPDGSFGGVVVTGVAPDFVAAAARAARPEEDGAAMVFSKTGAVLGQAPPAGPIADRRLAGDDLFEFYQRHPGAGSYIVDTPTGARIVSFSPVEPYPLVAAVSVGYDAALADWQRVNRIDLLLLGAAVFLVVVLAMSIERARRVHVDALERMVTERTLSLTLANAALQTQASTDELTGLANRRRFMAALDEEFARYRRYGGAFTLVSLDVDRFKTVNDGFGHEAGDHVLIALAQRVQSLLRDSDLFCRFGGEEFMLLLPQTEAAGGAAIAERLRAAIAAEPMTVAAGRPIAVTISAGVAAVAADDTADSLLRRADHALYAAKAGGRNQVVGAPSPA